MLCGKTGYVVVEDSSTLKVFTKIIRMLSWKAWVQRPSGLIKSGGSASAFKGKIP